MLRLYGRLCSCYPLFTSFAVVFVLIAVRFSVASLALPAPLLTSADDLQAGLRSVPTKCALLGATMVFEISSVLHNT